MKTMHILVVSLLFPVFAAAECVMVLADQPSSRKVQIIVLVGGKPLQDARVEVLQSGRLPLAVLLTDDHGVAKLPALRPGFYSIVATSANLLRSEMALHVLDRAKHKTSTFSLDLRLAVPTQEDIIASARRAPVTELLQSFKGIVRDQSGARVPGAVIQVFPKDSLEKLAAIRLRADENGNFSSSLAEGPYAVLVQFQGFQPWVAGLEIVRSGEAKELQITLNLGGGC
jgi:Carboxypeptidase regulatory-like domain